MAKLSAPHITDRPTKRSSSSPEVDMLTYCSATGLYALQMPIMYTLSSNDDSASVSDQLRLNLEIHPPDT